MLVPSAARRPHRIVARTLGLGVSALVAAAMLAWTPSATSGWNQGSAEATLWQLLNGARVNNGMAPVQQHSTLISLARWRSSDMLAKDYFSHTIAGCGCLVYAYYDSNGLNYVWGGENIGWNSGLDDSYSPVRVHERFMASPGHRSNVLNPAFTHGGVGAAAADGKMFQGYVQNTRMYTELFSQAPSAPAPPPPSGRWRRWWWRRRRRRRRIHSPGPTGRSAAQPRSPSPSRRRSRSTLPGGQPRPPASMACGPWSPRRRRSTSLVRHRAEETAAARVASQAVLLASAQAAAPAADQGDLQVQAAQASEPGLLDGIVSAVIGFLFG